MLSLMAGQASVDVGIEGYRIMSWEEVEDSKKVSLESHFTVVLLGEATEAEKLIVSSFSSCRSSPFSPTDSDRSPLDANESRRSSLLLGLWIDCMSTTRGELASSISASSLRKLTCRSTFDLQDEQTDDGGARGC